jgi:tetratricopeptide (TPR) repeat protein
MPRSILMGHWAGVLALFVACGPATAAKLHESWRRCIDSSAEIGIRGCTAVIGSGGQSGAALAVAFYNRGIAYQRKDQYERANGRGTAHKRASWNDRAIQDYDRAIRLKPDYAQAFVNRGIAYYDKGQYDRAIQDYDQAIRLKPDLAEAFNNRALAYHRKGRYDRAKQDFDQTIRLNQYYGNALINRALGPSDPPLAFNSRRQAGSAGSAPPPTPHAVE